MQPTSWVRRAPWDAPASVIAKRKFHHAPQTTLSAVPQQHSSPSLRQRQIALHSESIYRLISGDPSLFAARPTPGVTQSERGRSFAALPVASGLRSVSTMAASRYSTRTTTPRADDPKVRNHQAHAAVAYRTDWSQSDRLPHVCSRLTPQKLAGRPPQSEYLRVARDWLVGAGVAEALAVV